ncbi:hypothetical protein MJO28_002488 [Puccinia striiformis f. sp. tritici]|uniref:Uncharacterized protein n=1 Tax=Puccinia striiformis f. sp. tritici TaxID=168172 RepID=A0ACC0EQG5_9BASI|nr:hypothetical protein MJO28_002488 [Puccinia striiformis f. sp. tritici]
MSTVYPEGKEIEEGGKTCVERDFSIRWQGGDRLSSCPPGVVWSRVDVTAADPVSNPQGNDRTICRASQLELGSLTKIKSNAYLTCGTDAVLSIPRPRKPGMVSNPIAPSL